MQEFSSISVSSYEAGVLADRLTEQSGEGWEVVAIVPTGSTVTAYLSRPASVEAPIDDQAESQADGQADNVAAAVVATAVVAEPEPEPEPEPTPEPEPDQSTAETDDAGWAALASEVATTADDDESVPSSPETAPGIAEVAAVAGATEATDAVADVAAEVAAEPATEAATAGGAAPAGWYADPSSRFELRYWDGTQWTEHVSRAGQQYTDPPVA